VSLGAWTASASPYHPSTGAAPAFQVVAEAAAVAETVEEMASPDRVREALEILGGEGKRRADTLQPAVRLREFGRIRPPVVTPGSTSCALDQLIVT
jgi:hypothetical protein